MASHRIRRFCRLFATMVVLSLLSIFTYGFYLRRQADKLLADAKNLRVGTSDFSDAELISRRYRRFRIIGSGSVPVSANPADNQFSDACVADKCLLNFAIVNDPISRSRLVQRAGVGVTIAVLRGKVRYVEARVLGGPHGLSGGIVTEVDEASRTSQFSYTFPTPVGKPYLRVEVTPAAPQQVRERAWTLSTRCLMSRSGCDTPCDYLPLAWQDWKVSLVAKGVSESDFRISYPNDNRCR